MIRTVVATYLMVMAAVAPCACCCTTSRLLARFVPPAASEPEPARANVSPCCKHRIPADDGQQVPDRSDAPAKPGCPCQQRTTCAATLLPMLPHESVGEASRLTGGEWLLTSVAPSECPFLAPEEALEGRPPPGLPFLSTHTLLCVYHILRC